MREIPHDKSIDNTLSVLKEGYDFLHERRKENGRNVFTVRLMGMQMICLGGEEGAGLALNKKRPL